MSSTCILTQTNYVKLPRSLNQRLCAASLLSNLQISGFWETASLQPPLFCETALRVNRNIEIFFGSEGTVRLAG